MRKMDHSKKSSGEHSNYQIDFIESKAGYAHINITMPLKDFTSLNHAGSLSGS
jgi:hypothetical protein